MKTTVLITLPVIALLIAGCSDKSKPENTPPAQPPTLSERTDAAIEKGKQAAGDAKAAIEAKLTEWNLTPTDIKADLEKSGRIVREKTLATGEKVGGVLDNARIVTVINGKYVADSDLSALKINVDARDGVVTLNGTVGTEALAGRAVALALDTDGVKQVIGLLRIEHADVSETASGDSM